MSAKIYLLCSEYKDVSSKDFLIFIVQRDQLKFFFFSDYKDVSSKIYFNFSEYKERCQPQIYIFIFQGKKLSGQNFIFYFSKISAQKIVINFSE